MKAKSWVIVANRDKARIFNFERVGVLTELEALIQPEGKMKPQDLTSDKNGRGFDRVGSSRHGKEPKTSPREKEALSFAKKVSKYLEQSKKSGAFDNLYLLAETKFLGLLRQEMTPSVAECVEMEIKKDMLHMKPEAIWQLLPSY